MAVETVDVTEACDEIEKVIPATEDEPTQTISVYKSGPCLGTHEEGKELWRLLAKAAGVDHLRVRSITCRIASREVIKFEVELMGERERIAHALEAADTPATQAEAEG